MPGLGEMKMNENLGKAKDAELLIAHHTCLGWMLANMNAACLS
ncbi:unnamed protein product [Prunus armeniaca]|uniref:Uncharacterized protein n=1 Tax=Prunus armeniaca TaxID=36596 RepID=A0A6J5VPZ0_PRUAR|nr:unnamed protein product [Prunus armeniaca]